MSIFDLTELTEIQIERLKEAWNHIISENQNAKREDYRIIYHQGGNDIWIDYIPLKEDKTET